MSELVLVYTVFGNAEDARTVSRQLVEERLAACANIHAPCTSIYEWDGQLREEGEVPVFFKTTPLQRPALMERLAELHSYDVPAILSWSAEINDAYADWVDAQIAAKP